MATANLVVLIAVRAWLFCLSGLSWLNYFNVTPIFLISLGMVIYQTPHLIVSGPNLTNQAKLHSSLITRFFSTESSKVMDIDSCSLVFSVLFSETHFTRMIWDFNSYACNLYHRLVEQNLILETHQPRETCFMLCDQQTEFIKSK